MINYRVEGFDAVPQRTNGSAYAVAIQLYWEF